MFPREADGYGHFNIRGIATEKCTLKTVVRERVSQLLAESDTRILQAGDTFCISHKIRAKLCEYDLSIFSNLSNDPPRLITMVKELIAGDFFIIMGQSNAECGHDSGGVEYDKRFQHPYIRAIGGNFGWSIGQCDSLNPEKSMLKDCGFGRPHSSHTADYSTAYSGLWPVKLQSELALRSGIPNCVVNGSVGGSSIFENLPSHTPSVADSLRHSPGCGGSLAPLPYDRVYKKLYATNSIKGVRAVFYYQGESDGQFPKDSALNYKQRFKRLYNSWKADYPKLSQIFVLQLNLGCGDVNHHIIREIQRTMPDDYGDVTVMSTVGSPYSDRDPDMCHYTLRGYERIADKLIPVADKLLYNGSDADSHIMPPNVQKIYYSAPAEICIEFDKDVVFQDSCIYPLPHAGTAYLKDYFFDQDEQKLSVSKVQANNNKVYLNLEDEEKLTTRLTYLPRSFTHIPSLYAGPWILNKNNTELGAYSFYNVFVQQPLHVNKVIQKAFRIFPNPVTEFLDIEVANSENFSASLFDMNGIKMVEVLNVRSSARLNVFGVSRGVYILLIEMNDVVVRQKVVVQ